MGIIIDFEKYKSKKKYIFEDIKTFEENYEYINILEIPYKPNKSDVIPLDLFETLLRIT